MVIKGSRIRTNPPSYNRQQEQQPIHERDSVAEVWVPNRLKLFMVESPEILQDQ